MKTLTAELLWSGMFAVKETPSMFLFYYSKRRAYYLPKRAVGNPEEIAEIRERIIRELPPAIPFLNESPNPRSLR